MIRTVALQVVLVLSIAVWYCGPAYSQPDTSTPTNTSTPTPTSWGIEVTDVHASGAFVFLDNCTADLTNVYGTKAEIQIDAGVPTPSGTPAPFIVNACAVYAELDMGPGWISGERLSIRGIGGRAMIGPKSESDSADLLEIYQPLSDAYINPSSAVSYDLDNCYLTLGYGAGSGTWVSAAEFPCPLPHSGESGTCTRIVGVKAVFSEVGTNEYLIEAQLILKQASPATSPTSTSSSTTPFQFMDAIAGTGSKTLGLTDGWDVALETYGPQRVWALVKMKYTSDATYSDLRLHGLVWQYGDVKY